MKLLSLSSDKHITDTLQKAFSYITGGHLKGTYSYDTWSLDEKIVPIIYHRKNDKISLAALHLKESVFVRDRLLHFDSCWNRRILQRPSAGDKQLFDHTRDSYDSVLNIANQPAGYLNVTSYGLQIHFTPAARISEKEMTYRRCDDIFK